MRIERSFLIQSLKDGESHSRSKVAQTYISENFTGFFLKPRRSYASMIDGEVVERWRQATALEVESMFDLEERFCEEERLSRTQNCWRAFHEFFQAICKEIGCKADFTQILIDSPPTATGIIVRCEKPLTEIRLGVDYNGYYLNWWIRFGEYLHRVPDEFYGHILKLSEYGTLRYERIQFDAFGEVSKEWQRKIDSSRSVVFGIIRDCLASHTCGEYGRGIGDVVLEKPLDSTRDQLLEFFQEGIRHIYKANYILYRLHYLNLKHQEKQLEKLTGSKIDLI